MTQNLDEAELQPGNLPSALTELLGRESALEELAALLAGSRLVTLCGPGGAGKSRLALALADTVREDRPGGAWWADLSSTVDSGLVAQTVAAAVLPGTPASDPVAAVARLLADPSLLVLDNCEQVVSGCADLIIELLARAPRLSVIVTSRQSLGIPGEHVWRVPGLSIADPPPSELPSVGRKDAPAIALFMQRARESADSFAPDAPGTRETVGEICRWLDGIPLAIELAAARVSVLKVELIAERLESDPGLLRHSCRAAPGRHRTLQDTLEWSHRLPESDEQCLFRRLGAFPSSFSLQAAEEICPDQLIVRADVLELLSLLIDRSLVHVVESPGGPRFRLAPTVRQYAAQKLEQSGELESTRACHAEFYRALGERARVGLAGPDQIKWLEGLELDHDNLVAALQWLFAHACVKAAELAFALWPFSYQRGYYREARAWFEQVLACADDLPDPVTIEALLKAGEVSFLQCDYEVAVRLVGGRFRARREVRAPGPDRVPAQRKPA